MKEEKNGLKWPVVAVSIVCLVIVVGVWWWVASSEMPRVNIPNPTMPKLNGYDIFDNAGLLLREEKKILFASSDYPPGKRPPVPEERDYTLPEKEELVKINAPTLEMIREGLKHNCRAHPCRSFDTLYRPELESFRTEGRLLKLEAEVRIAQGDWNGAMNSCLDGMEMGSDITRGGDETRDHFGCAIQSYDREFAWRPVEHLNARDAKSAITRLERIISQRPPISETLEQEKWRGMASLLEIFGKPYWRKAFLPFTCPPPGPFENACNTLSSLRLSKTHILYAYQSHMDKTIAASRKPYPSVKLPTAPNDNVSQILLETDFHGTIFAGTRTDCANSLLLVTLALRAYKLDNGVYPNSLNELVPGYLKKQPVDPFTLNKPFEYKRTASGYLLYSLGPDCKDDGGKPIDHPSKPANVRHSVFSDKDKGDFVAGINR